MKKITFPIAIFLVALAAFLIPTPLLAQEPPSSVTLAHTRLTLVSEKNAIMASEAESFKVGVLLEAFDGWHTYWQNPGDAGLPTTLQWLLPEGFMASDIDWPTPERVMEGDLTTHSYTGTVFLPVTITPPAPLGESQPFPVRVRVDLLVCKEICVPESAELQIILPVSKHAPKNSEHAKLFEKHNKKRVQRVDKPASFTFDDTAITISVPTHMLRQKDIRHVTFFPHNQNVFNYSAEQKFAATKDALNITIARAEGGEIPPVLSGIVSVASADKITSSYSLTFKSATTATGTNSAAGLWLPYVLLLAFIGGMVLNLMPCVLPVLSLKALAIAKKSGEAQAQVMRQGLAYTAGILISFALIAGILFSLRAGGEAIGWGYQMQSPAFVGFLIYLLFLVGLSLSGFFHLPVLLGNIGGNLASDSSVSGSFFTGVLATAVATPCTAPFMAPAIGAALTMPAFSGLLVFMALGLGLAAPFLLISLFPRARAFLPRPGAWMETFKQLLAFPIYASVIWLLWVLTLQTGASGMAITLCGMLLIVLLIWLQPLFSEKPLAYRVLALLGFLFIMAMSLPTLDRMQVSANSNVHAIEGIPSVPYSKEALAELRNAGKAVYVDATAAWCLTCQLNARSALLTPRTLSFFKQQEITLMIADWTLRNEEITAFLSSFGYEGVPLNVFYPAGGDPVILPQLLTENIVINTITTKGQ
jgi:thiol:disulfide interchange protein